MSNQRPLQALEAAFTRCEKNNRAQLLEQNAHLFLVTVKDGRPVFARRYADTARGRDVISGHAPRHYPKPDLSDHTSLPIE
jgi:hypothetical protein